MKEKITTARNFAKLFYKRKQWLECRAAYIAERKAIDGGLCETCHDRLGYIVHHTIWLTQENINDPNIALNHEHLKYDCLICHNKERENAGQEMRYVFDAEGQPVPVSPPPEKCEKF